MLLQKTFCTYCKKTFCTYNLLYVITQLLSNALKKLSRFETTFVLFTKVDRNAPIFCGRNGFDDNINAFATFDVP